MKNNKRLVPKRRFKEFENDSEWKRNRLGENSKIIAGGTPSTKKSEYWYPKVIPWMSSGEVNKKRLYDTDDYISELGYENSSATWIKPKSVLIALAGQGKTRGTVALNEMALTTNQSIAGIVPYDKSLYSEFLYYNLDDRYEELRLKSSGDGSRGGLNKKILSNFNIIAPNIIEQEKIGNFFKKLDNLINLQQGKLIKSNNLKSAYLSDLFPKEGEKYPELRFEGFTDPWKKSNLEAIAEIHGGNSWSSDNYSTEGSHLVITIANVSGAYLIDISEANKITPDNDIYVLSEGDILISMTGNVGRVSKVPKVRAVLNQRVAKLIINLEIDKEFIFVILQDKKFEDKMILSGQGAAQLNISKSDILNYEFMIPTYSEQEKIGDFFKKLNKQIELEEEKLDKLEKIKEAYLNELFV